jgi:hypothetical protein
MSADVPTMEAVQPFVEWIIKLGPGGIFALLWWLERKERIETGKSLIQTLQSMRTMNDAWLKILGRDGREPS